jgi:hypothetical protein
MTVLQSMESSKTWQKISINLPRWSTAWLRVLLSNCAGAKAISLALLAAIALPANAIIFYSTGDTEHNTTAPTGTLANSGWELQGNWGANLGTPIGPHHFITANHVGGAVGDPFYFRGVSYATISTTGDSASDLRIWEIAGTFPAWADLYNGVTETGADLMVYGRGMTRGAEVRVNGALKGWQWGAYDARMRWGQNKVASISTTANYPSSDVLVVAFNTNGSAEEAQIAYGDSGGGVFVKDGTAWRLAGINFTVDGPYNTSSSGAGFQAAIFDEGGLYKKTGTFVFTPDLPTAQPGNFTATRIKSRISWIQGVLAGPLTSWPATLVQSTSANGTFTAVENATWDSSAKTFRVPLPTGPAFFQIRGAASVTITSSRVENGTMVLSYE